jgi:MerR family mercuric resistance operon transcriptional regulator
MSESYRIGEIAQQAGVSVEAVRYYERIGVLGAAPRTGRGIRRYPHEAIERIQFVKQAQQNGLTLAEIRELIALKQRGGARRCKQVQQLLAAKIAQLDEQRAQLDEFRRTLQALADQCEESLRAAPDPECPVIAKI